MVCSPNIRGSPLFRLIAGHLSRQIEHHLFPDLPARRYPEVAAQVEAVAQRHGIPYNTGSFWTQYGAVLQRIWQYSWPDKPANKTP